MEKLPNTRIAVNILLFALGLMCVHLCKCSQTSNDSDKNLIVGQCGDEGENCTACYQALVKSLMSKDQNLFYLSKAFFPTNSNDRPQFVTITYCFKDTKETKIWYWSEKGSYFIYPLETFEYLSLFFGKASAFFTGNVTVTLDQECLHADDDFMEHLTQRIKLYVAKKSITPEIDDSYIATAHNDESWSRVLKAHNDQIVKIVYCTPTLAAGVLIVMVVVFMFTAWYNCKRSLKRSKSHSEDNSAFSRSTNIISCNVRPAIVAGSLLSQVFIIYTLGVSCYACSEINNQPNFTSNSTPLSKISIMVAIGDGIVLLSCIVTDIIALLMAVAFYHFDCAFILLSCTIFCASLSVLLHSPYIILAYINDASLTGSMFIFYTITLSSQFLAINRLYTVYHELVLPCHDKILNRNGHQKIDPNGYQSLNSSLSQSLEEVNRHRNIDTNRYQSLDSSFNRSFEEVNRHRNTSIDPYQSLNSSLSQSIEEVNRHRRVSYSEDEPLLLTERAKLKRSEIICELLFFVLYSLILCIIITGLVVLLTCYLIILPITNGLSHLFGRLFDTYNTAIVIIGAFAAYKTFIEKKNESDPQAPKEESNHHTYQEPLEPRAANECDTRV